MSVHGVRFDEAWGMMTGSEDDQPPIRASARGMLAQKAESDDSDSDTSLPSPPRVRAVTRPKDEAEKSDDKQVERTNLQAQQLASLVRELTGEIRKSRRATEQKCTSNLLAIVIVALIVVVCLAFSIQAYRRLRVATEYLAWCCEQRMRVSPIYQPLA
jgi:type II secretory pathway component PulL